MMMIIIYYIRYIHYNINVPWSPSYSSSLLLSIKLYLVHYLPTAHPTVELPSIVQYSDFFLSLVREREKGNPPPPKYRE